MRNDPPLIARRLARARFLIWLGFFAGATSGAATANAHDHIVVEIILCASACAPTVMRVWDGDTVRIGFGPGSERVRLAEIDAPEIAGQCKAEIDLALRSQFRLAELLRGGEVTIVRQGRDSHGRSLATLHVGGADAGQILVREGLARDWSGRCLPWCG